MNLYYYFSLYILYAYLYLPVKNLLKHYDVQNYNNIFYPPKIERVYPYFIVLLSFLEKKLIKREQ